MPENNQFCNNLNSVRYFQICLYYKKSTYPFFLSGAKLHKKTELCKFSTLLCIILRIVKRQERNEYQADTRCTGITRTTLKLLPTHNHKT